MPRQATPRTFQLLASDFLQDRYVKHVSPNTIRFYAFALTRFLQWADQADASPATFGPRELRAFLTWLETEGKRPGNRQKMAHGTLCPRTFHAYARTIRALLVFGAKEGVLEAAPVLDMPRVPKARPDFLSDDQVDKLLAACEPRERALIAFMLDTALRRQELADLRWGDVA